MSTAADDKVRKERLSVLDQTLLFLSSFLSFFFGVVIVYINPPDGIALSSLAVFVVVTTIFPLYVGVMRGGIEHSQGIRERMRGWVYLIFGGSLFLSLLVFHFVTIPIGPTTSITSALYDDLVALIVIPLMFLIMAFTIRFVSWAYKTIDGTKPSGADLSTIYGTIGGIFFSMLFFLAIAVLGRGFNIAPITNPVQGQGMTIIQSAVMLLPLLLVEFNCHHEELVLKADSGYRKYVARNPQLETPPRDSLLTRAVVLLVEAILRASFMLSAGIERSSLPRYFVIFAIGTIIAESLLPAYFLPSIVLIIASEVLLCYGIWRHVRTIWATEGRGET